MKVFLKQDIEKIGMAGEIVKVGDGYARNYLIPRNIAIEITPQNQSFYQSKIKSIEHRKEVIESKTSMLAERINTMKITIKRKMHDDGKLYGAISQGEVVDLLAEQGVSINKSQVVIDKSIKSKGAHKVVIKLTSRLQPELTLNVLPE
ncbi:MAG TPA: 50S ribosomal protein L9 [Candidatus Dependentiae bacterium]|nr:50S ribosomal protein L9 [Candidatus Dependentiae bacterium]HRQ62464.1 50S ribosomal protein L9 [Candidatus Dependentiae bacterium]